MQDKSALIIGGGFGGCSTAHQLEMQGGWDVTLVERRDFLGLVIKQDGMVDILILLVQDIFSLLMKMYLTI